MPLELLCPFCWRLHDYLGEDRCPELERRSVNNLQHPHEREEDRCE